jgi:hypothetical protein
MKAKKVFHDKSVFPDGTIVEMVLWELPAATADHPQRLKYRLHYGLPGKTLVRYDNEKGKGHHKHLGATEQQYNFKDVDSLVSDFLKDVESYRKRKK